MLCVKVQHQKSLMFVDIELSLKDRYRENCRFRDNVSRSKLKEKVYSRGSEGDSSPPHNPIEIV